MAVLALIFVSAKPTPPVHYETAGLVKEEYKLNSGSRPGGVTRQVVTLSIPAGTEYVYYSVTTSPKGPLQDLALHTQLHKRVTEQGFSMSVASSILNELLVPQGDGVCDVIFLDGEGDAQRFLNKQDGSVTYIGNYNRLNVSKAVVGIPIPISILPTTKYLCIRNPSAFNAQFVSVEVVAIVKKLK